MSAVLPSHRQGAAVTEELLRAAINLIAERGPALSTGDVDEGWPSADAASVLPNQIRRTGPPT